MLIRILQLMFFSVLKDITQLHHTIPKSTLPSQGAAEGRGEGVAIIGVHHARWLTDALLKRKEGLVRRDLGTIGALSL